MNIEDVKIYIKKDYPLIYNEVKDMKSEEFHKYEDGILTSIASINYNINTIKDIEEVLHLESLEEIDKTGTVFDKEFTVLEKYIEAENAYGTEKPKEHFTETKKEEGPKLLIMLFGFLVVLTIAITVRHTLFPEPYSVLLDIASCIAYALVWYFTTVFRRV